MTAASGPGFPVHAPVPRADTAYTMEGPRAGRLIDNRFTRSFPAEGICAGCGQMIRQESQADGWEHTGRMPGEPG